MYSMPLAVSTTCQLSRSNVAPSHLAPRSCSGMNDRDVPLAANDSPVSPASKVSSSPVTVTSPSPSKNSTNAATTLSHSDRSNASAGTQPSYRFQANRRLALGPARLIRSVISWAR